MVKVIVPLTIAMATGTVSATNLFLTTLSIFTNGKTQTNDNQLYAYDNNTLTPCSKESTKYQAFCDVAPNYTGSKISACAANYTGTQPWKDIAGYFYNTKGYFVQDGTIGIDRKNGTNFAYNVTKSSNCHSFKCSITANNATATFGGFKCTV